MISIVYICPSFLPQYVPSIERFCESYWLNTDFDHEFLLVLKGPSLVPACFERVPKLVLVHPNENMDCGSYQMVCQQFQDREAICFLGANTLLVDDEWLPKLSSALLETDAKIVGACGSYETGVSCRPYNPHIRSTGFMVRPKDLLELYPDPITCRRDCIEFESGANSLTRRVMERGGQCLVVGRDGKRYGVEDWGKMGGFRQGDQSNLLIWDNQSDAFHRYTAGDKWFMNQQTFPGRSD